MPSMRRWWPPVLAAGILVLALCTLFWAAANTGAADKTGGSNDKVSKVVKTIINRGADIYNTSRDYNGCYRYYQGSLTALKAMLDDHPDLQKAIDAGLAEAERNPSITQRGRILNTTLRKIYDKFNPKPAVKDKEKPRVDKGPNDKPPLDKDGVPRDFKEVKKEKEKEKPVDSSKKEKEKPADSSKKDKPDDKATKGKVTGKVTFKGKPVTSGTIIFTDDEEVATKATIGADGTYTIAALPPGGFTITIDSPKSMLPKKYSNVDQSGLTLTVKKGDNSYNVDLK